MRRAAIVFLLLLIVVLGLLAAASAAPVASAYPRTFCKCVHVGYGIWCYRCCDYYGCDDLYCGVECP